MNDLKSEVSAELRREFTREHREKARQPSKYQKDINVTFAFPPIPYRGCDWQASFDGYEPGDPLGHGLTPEAAVEDLMEQAWEEARENCSEADYG